jgi:hypothetical protein
MGVDLVLHLDAEKPVQPQPHGGAAGGADDGTPSMEGSENGLLQRDGKRYHAWTCTHKDGRRLS